jgi:CHAT domain-containing protein
VDDAATADLITAYVKARAAGRSDVDALRDAMLATRERYPQPEYWAAFTLVGLP